MSTMIDEQRSYNLMNMSVLSESIQDVKPPNLAFKAKTLPVDWQRIVITDLDRIINEMDVTSLQELILNITYCNIDMETTTRAIDPHFVKLFKISQLIIEYLLNTQTYISNVAQNLEANSTVYQKKLENNKEVQKNMEMEMLELRKENKRRKRLLEEQQRLLHNFKFSAYVCPVCSKAFENFRYLQKHVDNRHFDIALKLDPNSKDGKMNEEQLENKYQNELKLMESKWKKDDEEKQKKYDDLQEEIKKLQHQMESQSDLMRRLEVKWKTTVDETDNVHHVDNRRQQYQIDELERKNEKLLNDREKLVNRLSEEKLRSVHDDKLENDYNKFHNNENRLSQQLGSMQKKYYNEEHGLHKRYGSKIDKKNEIIRNLKNELETFQRSYNEMDIDKLLEERVDTSKSSERKRKPKKKIKRLSITSVSETEPVGEQTFYLEDICPSVSAKYKEMKRKKFVSVPDKKFYFPKGNWNDFLEGHADKCGWMVPAFDDFSNDLKNLGITNEDEKLTETEYKSKLNEFKMDSRKSISKMPNNKKYERYRKMFEDKLNVITEKSSREKITKPSSSKSSHHSGGNLKDNVKFQHYNSSTPNSAESSTKLDELSPSYSNREPRHNKSDIFTSDTYHNDSINSYNMTEISHMERSLSNSPKKRQKKLSTSSSSNTSKKNWVTTYTSERPSIKQRQLSSSRTSKERSGGNNKLTIRNINNENSDDEEYDDNEYSRSSPHTRNRTFERQPSKRNYRKPSYSIDRKNSSSSIASNSPRIQGNKRKLSRNQTPVENYRDETEDTSLWSN
ncbi:hypothetical protein SNEBB_004515 [Seison nebaliae]|nr:hypothetical protein SNEBB_004515 [Seison nebaliae]